MITACLLSGGGTSGYSYLFGGAVEAITNCRNTDAGD